jgi:hypothetical protein
MLCLMSTLIALILLFVKSKASLHHDRHYGFNYLYFKYLYQTQNFVLFYIIFYVIGAVASSRLEMKAHKHKGGTNRMLVDHNFIDAFVVIKYKKDNP